MSGLDAYQVQALRTWDPALSTDQGLALGGLGISGEAGEVTDLIKKVLFHGKPLDRSRIIDELGDVLWYIAILAKTVDAHLSDVAAANVAKLQAPYPDGFKPGLAKIPAHDLQAVAPPKPPGRVVVRVTADVPPFVDQDLKTVRLRAGDVATVAVGVADLLVRRGKAVPMEVPT